MTVGEPVKLKYGDQLITTPRARMGRANEQLHHSCRRHKMEVSDQLHAPSIVHRIGVQVGLRPCGYEKITPAQIRTPVVEPIGRSCTDLPRLGEKPADSSRIISRIHIKADIMCMSPLLRYLRIVPCRGFAVGGVEPSFPLPNTRKHFTEK